MVKKFRNLIFNQSVLATILKNHTIVFLLLIFSTIHLAAISLNIYLWQCPIKATFDIPCPGCGLGSAIVLLLKGEFHTAFTQHVFAPLFLLGIGLLIIVLLLPMHLREAVIRKISEFERRTGAGNIILFALLIYSLTRIVIYWA